MRNTRPDPKRAAATYINQLANCTHKWSTRPMGNSTEHSVCDDCGRILWNHQKAAN